MSLTATRMIALLRSELGGLDEDDLPEDDAIEFLNLSLWELEDKFPFKARESSATLPIVEGTDTYSLASLTRLDAITSVAIRLSEEAGYESHKLARMTRDWYDANYSGGSNVGLPTRYMREGNNLILYPTPDSDTGGLNLRISFKQGIASIAADSTGSGLPRNWDEIVVAGAAWRGHKAKGDYNIAQQAANFQIGLIRSAVPVEAKEERDSRYARLNVIWEWPEEELEGYEGGI